MYTTVTALLYTLCLGTGMHMVSGADLAEHQSIGDPSSDIEPLHIGPNAFPALPPTTPEPLNIESKVLGPFRLWHIIGFVATFILVILVIVSCCCDCRIPRTKQEIMDKRMGIHHSPIVNVEAQPQNTAMRVLVNGLRPPTIRGNVSNTQDGATASPRVGGASPQVRRYGGVETPFVVNPLLNRQVSATAQAPGQAAAAKTMASIPPHSFAKK